MSIVLTSSNFQNLENLCDSVLLLDNGRLVWKGDPKLLNQTYKIGYKIIINEIIKIPEENSNEIKFIKVSIFSYKIKLLSKISFFFIYQMQYKFLDVLFSKREITKSLKCQDIKFCIA